MMDTGNPLQTEQGHSQSTSQDQNRNRDLLRGLDMEDLHKGVDETLGVSDHFLLDLAQDTAITGDMLNPDQNTEP